MLKNKSLRLTMVAVVIFSMIAMYVFVPIARAAITDAKDLITDSDRSATATHTITFTTSVDLVATDYMEITFAPEFANENVANLTCPGTMTEGVAGDVITCTAAGGVASGTQQVTITNVTNPNAAGPYTITIVTKNSGGTELEDGTDVKVYIIDDVVVTATVLSTLTFSISGLGNAVDVNGVQTTEDNSATTTALEFGDLSTTASSTVGQQLSVATNATDGFTVTVQQDYNMLSAGGADIDAFQDGTPPPGALQPWAAPTPVIDTENTYGHLGITSEDSTISGSDPFGTALYDGFDGTTALAVMYHNGPADGATAGAGVTQVAYTIEISVMQEAGDYTNTLTYICTPQF